MENTSMPVNDLDQLDCWENIEFCLLSLDEERFELVYKDHIQSTKSQKEIKVIEDKQRIEEISGGDTFIAEMEKMFMNGDQEAAMEMLKKYE
jgi:hypothetical protein